MSLSAVEDLLAKAGIAETTDGTQLSAAQLLRIADEAEIWPAIIDRNGVPLALGRTRRIASRGQTMALIAREGGCSFPGCDHPPQWCDRHHIIDWIDGGPTDLDNMTLLCRYHHTHFLQKGWTCRINADGLPEWIPPRWIDPEQRPQLHTPNPTPAHPTATQPATTREGCMNETELPAMAHRYLPARTHHVPDTAAVPAPRPNLPARRRRQDAAPTGRTILTAPSTGTQSTPQGRPPRPNHTGRPNMSTR